MLNIKKKKNALTELINVLQCGGWWGWMLIEIHEACKVSHLPQTRVTLGSLGKGEDGRYYNNRINTEPTELNQVQESQVKQFRNASIAICCWKAARTLKVSLSSPFSVTCSDKIINCNENTFKCNNCKCLWESATALGCLNSMWQHQNSVWEVKVAQIPLMHNVLHSQTLRWSAQCYQKTVGWHTRAVKLNYGSGS